MRRPVSVGSGEGSVLRFRVDCGWMRSSRSVGMACCGRDLKDVDRIVMGDCRGRDTRRKGLPIEDFES